MTPEDRPENGPAQRRFFYGYVIVFSCFVVMVLTFGINYSFGKTSSAQSTP